MRRMKGWLFGAGLAAALGFGGTQALAAPAVDAEARKVCDPVICNRVCQAIPGSIGGFCTSSGSCVCYIGG
jgi:hypothetical protein